MITFKTTLVSHFVVVKQQLLQLGEKKKEYDKRMKSISKSTNDVFSYDRCVICITFSSLSPPSFAFRSYIHFLTFSFRFHKEQEKRERERGERHVKCEKKKNERC